MIKDSRLLIAGLAFLSGMAVFCLPPQPEYWPVCTNPQPIAPIQPGGGTALVCGSPIVWNGQDYATSYIDNLDNSVHFRRFFADGTPATDSLSILPAANGEQSALVWNGNGYGVAFQFYDGSYYVIYFCRLSVDGAPIGTPVQISFYESTATGNCFMPSIAWSGSSYAITWMDDRNGNLDIYATLLNSDGTVANSGISHDVLICGEIGVQSIPSIVWVQGINRYYIFWHDARTGTITEIYGGELHPLGLVYTFGPLVSDVSASRRPDVVNTGSYLGMVWEDYRDENYEIYFARISPASYSKVGNDIRLTNNSGSSTGARIIWTGAEYGVFWNEGPSADYDYNIGFQRVSAAGVPQGGNVMIESAAGLGFPYAAFANYGYMITGKYSAYSNYVIPFGCAAVDTPTCPGGFVAYNITGTTATIGWLPSSDAAQDIAYYQVYRNAVPIAKTSSTFYNDTGLSVGGTYAYAVQPVNAGQVQNTSCQTTFYVKTNASLTLTVAKNDNGSDAELLWNDAGLNNYNIFRGTSPQVMSQIGATGEQQYNDPNVLMDSNIYYYTVDEPGW